MPTRPSSHQLEEQSRLAFRSLLPKSWLFRDKTPDYGIDGEVKTFDEVGKATGVQFLVQLKAIERTRKSLNISLDIEWINYYHSLELPVLLALWVKDSNKVFWIWATDIDLYYAKPKAKSLTVGVPNIWDQDTPGLIDRHLQLRRRLLSQQSPAPLKIVLQGTSCFQVRAKLQALCGNAPRKLIYNESAPDVVCVLQQDELKIAFNGLRGTVLHSMRKVDDQTAARQIVVGVSITLANYGALNQAAELWVSVPHLDKAVVSLDVAWRIVSMLARACAFPELRSLIDALAPRFTTPALSTPLYALLWSAPLHRRAQLTELLAEIERRDLKDSTPEGRSMASYNLAQLYNDVSPKISMRHRKEAIRASSFYAEKAYFWKALGAFLFTRHRYRAALRSYEHAYVTLGETERRGHYGDALMHTGRYLDALRVFRDIVERGNQRSGVRANRNDSDSLDIADATIKVRVLEQITHGHGIDSQERQRRMAIEALGGDIQKLSNLAVIERCDLAIRADATYGGAWFNRGLALGRLGREADAFASFLTAAAVRTPDDEAWLKVLFLAVKHGPDLMSSVLQFLAHQRGPEFVQFMAQAAERQSDDVGRTVLLDLAKLFAENLPEPEDAVMRVYGKKGLKATLKVPTR